MSLNVMWAANAPWCASGYGVQSREIVPGLKRLGHHVDVFSWWGLMGGIMEYQGMKIYPAFGDPYGNDVVREHANHADSDLVIGLVDLWVQGNYADTLPQRWMPYFPIDSIPIPPEIYNLAKRTQWPVTYSQWGVNELAKVGVQAYFVPHGVGDAYRPNLEAGRRWRMENGIPQDAFMVASVYANKGNPSRKNFDGCFRAFAEFSKTHPDAVYYCHSEPSTRYQGVDLWRLIRELGIAGKVIIPNSYLLALGFDESWMAGMYNAADVLLSATKGEGWCLIPGTKIWTDEGARNIESIATGQKVISHTGNWRQVSKTTHRNYTGQIVTLSPRYGMPPLQLTPEHRVRAIKRTANRSRGMDRLSTDWQWIAASELQAGDFIWYPRYKPADIPSICFSDVLPVIPDMFGMVQLKGGNQFGAVFPHPASRCKTDNISIDQDLMTIAGYYVSEGSTGHGATTFAFHTEETEYHQRLKDAFWNKFGLNGSEKSQERHRYTYAVYDTLIARWLSTSFGNDAYCKHLPAWALHLPDDLLWGLLERLFEGDGCLQVGKYASLSYSTVSEELAEQIQFLLARLGILAYLKRHYRLGRWEYDVRISRTDLDLIPFVKQEGLPPLSKQGRRGVVFNDGFAIPIKQVGQEQYDGVVYNLEVDQDESYLTASGVVHNCIPITEAQSCGTPVIVTNYSAMIEQVDQHPGPSYKVRVAEWEICPLHSRFAIPDTEDIVKGLEMAYNEWRGGKPFKELSTWAEQYYWDNVITNGWGPMLARVEHDLNRMQWKSNEHPVLSTAVNAGGQ